MLHATCHVQSHVRSHVRALVSSFGLVPEKLCMTVCAVRISETSSASEGKLSLCEIKNCGPISEASVISHVLFILEVRMVTISDHQIY